MFSEMLQHLHQRCYFNIERSSSTPPSHLLFFLFLNSILFIGVIICLRYEWMPLPKYSPFFLEVFAVIILSNITTFIKLED